MRRREFLALIAPSVIVMFGLLTVPLFRTIQWSFQTVVYGEAGAFVGLQNYLAALTDARFGRAVLFTVGLTVAVIAPARARLPDRDPGQQLGRLQPLVLGILLISYVIPHVVGSAAFSWLFDTNFGGVANYLL